MEFYLSKKNLIPYTEYTKNTKISIIGIPYDGTSIEYPGQRFAPKEIRDILGRQYGLDLKSNINFYDEIEDLGDIEIVHGSYSKTEETILKFIEKFKEQRNTLPLFLGGEHSITYSTVKALAKYKDFDLIVFDAHTDCFDSYAGEKISHISYLNKLISEKIINSATIIGARAITKEEKEFMQKNNIKYYKPEEIDINKIIKDTTKQIYLSIDIDVLDFDLAIGTGTPEINGLKLKELIAYTNKIISAKEIVGMDIVEVNPMLEGARITLYSTAFLIRELIFSYVKSYKAKKSK